MLKYSLVFVITFLSVSVSNVHLLRNPMRTVKVCNQISGTSTSLSTGSKQCEDYCKQNFINVDSKIRNANKDLARVIVSSSGTNQTNCCCEFNTFWPDFVTPSAAGIRLNNQRRIGPTSCLPLVVTLKVCKRSVQSYETVCKYLSKKEPLTMLELVEFLEAASYLMTVKPRHPSILRTMSLKEVKTIDKSAPKIAKEIIDKYFLTSYKPFELYEGSKLDTGFLRAVTTDLRASLMNPQRSRVVADAVDEYLVSYTMVDMHAAYVTIVDVNRNQLMIPENLLAGDYDKYNKDNKAGFHLEGCNCSLLKKVKTDLTSYLRVMSQVLSSLNEKLIYEHLSIDFKDLTYLISSEKIYNNLYDVNCRRR